MITNTRRAVAASVLALTLLAGTAASAAEQGITAAEVCAVQKAWVKGVLDISAAYARGGTPAARPVAEEKISELYAYDQGPTLFKPTLTEDPNTFRLTKRGAVAYFVGGDPEFPGEPFVAKNWGAVKIRNIGFQRDQTTISVMSRADFTAENPANNVSVDKAWIFKKYGESVRIILHHSSVARPPTPPAAELPGSDPCDATPAQEGHGKH